MSNNSFTSVLQGFGETLGIVGLALDEYASCMLSVDSLVLNLQWKEASSTLLLYAPIGCVEEWNDNRTLYELLLEANCLGSETGGLTLGIQPGLGAILLSGHVSTLGMDKDQLCAFVAFFSDQASLWTRRVVELKAADIKTSPRDEIPVFGLRI